MPTIGLRVLSLFNCLQICPENSRGCFRGGSGAKAERTNFQSVNQFAVREQPTFGERWWGISYSKAKVGSLSTFSESHSLSVLFSVRFDKPTS